MAQSGPTDITFNEFKNLPTEIKVLVLSKLPIREIFKKGFVDDNTEVGSAVDEFIKHYIDTQLFTDVCIFNYLIQIKSYDIILNKKLFEMGHDFFKECNRLDETPNSKQTTKTIFFDIKYKKGTVKNTNIKDYVKFFRYHAHEPMVLTSSFLREHERLILTDVGGCMDFTEKKSIDWTISGTLNYLMITCQLQSIELVETTYTENHTRNDLIDSYKGDFRVIKKYY